MISKQTQATLAKLEKIIPEDPDQSINFCGPFRYSKIGTTFRGEFLNKKKHGYGLEVYPNGGLYEGQFLNGKRHGHGREIMGSLKSSIQPGGSIVSTYSEKKNYQSRYFNLQQHLIDSGYKEGDYYEGEWQEDVRSGRGKEVKESGKVVYEGKWSEDKKNGLGKETISSSTEHFKIIKTSNEVEENQGFLSDRSHARKNLAVGGVYEGF